jgi:hypothetical protein
VPGAATFIELGKLDVANGSTIDLGNIVLQVPKGNESSVQAIL